MTWNLVIQWLNEFEDGNEFERLCNDIVARHWGPVNPTGGTGDRGVDAVLVADRRTIFQYSVNKDWANKVRKTLKELQDKSVLCKQLIFITSRKKHAAEEVKLQMEAQQKYDISLQVFDQEFLRLYIERYEDLHVYFASQREQLIAFDVPDDSVWIAPKLRRSKRRALVLLSTLVRNPESEHLRAELAEQLVLGAVFAAGGKGTCRHEQIIKELYDMFGTDEAISSELVDTALHNLIRSGQIRSTQDGYKLSDFAHRDMLEQIHISRENDSVFYKQLVDEVETQTDGLSADQGREVREAFSQLFCDVFDQFGLRVAQALSEQGGLEPKSVPVVNILIMDNVERFPDESLKQAVRMTMMRIFTRPSEFEAEYLARIADSFFAYHCFNLDPQCRILEQDYVRRYVVLLDTDLIIQALAGHLEYGPVYRSLFARMRDLGLQVYAFTDSIEEAVYRIELANRKYVDDLQRPSKISSFDANYIQDLFIRTYFVTDLRQRLTWDQFISSMIGLERSREAQVQHVESWLYKEYGIETRGFERQVSNAHQDTMKKIATEIAYRREETLTFKHMDLYESDAKLVTIVQQLQQEIDPDGKGACTCWCVSSDAVLYKVWDDCLDSRPPMFTPYGWIQYIASFPRSKGSPKDFAHFMRALTVSPMRLRIPQRLVIALIRLGVDLERYSMDELEQLYERLLSDVAWKLHLESPDEDLNENLDDLRKGIERVLEQVAEPTKEEVERLRGELGESRQLTEKLIEEQKRLTGELERMKKKERSRKRYLRHQERQKRK